MNYLIVKIIEVFVMWKSFPEEVSADINSKIGITIK
jgi:hypothetical protein